MRNFNFLLLATVLTALVGCKSSDSPSPAAPKPNFSLSSESHKALMNAGCDARDGSVKCDDVEDLHGIRGQTYELRNLKNRKSVVEKQIEALNTAISELDDADKKDWSAESKIDLTTLKTTATTTKASLVAKSASLTAQISQEELFNSVIGYTCSGNYDLFGRSTEFKDSMYFMGSGAQTPEGVDKETTTDGEKSQTYYRKNIADSDASIWMKEVASDVRLRVGSAGAPSQKIDEIDVLSVWMDGEFTVKSHGVPFHDIHAIAYDVKNASCFKIRLSNANPTEITQRIVERGPRLKCSAASSKPKAGVNELEYFGGRNIHLNFNEDKNEPRVFSTYLDNIDVTFQRHVDEGYRYFFDVSNTNGSLEFELLNLVSGEVVLSVKTVNSSNNISLNYLNQGYGARIDCVPSEN